MVIFDEAYKKFLTGKSDEELLCMADILANAEFKLIRKLTFESLVKERDAQHEAGNAQEHTQKPQDRRSTESQGNNTAKEENAPEEGCDDDRHVALILRDCLPIMSNYPTLTALTASYNLLMRKFSLCCVHGERKTLEKLAKQIYNSLLEEIETWQK